MQQRGLPIPTSPTSPRRYSSTSGVVGSLLSYGRSQTFLSGSNIPSSSLIPIDGPLRDEENVDPDFATRPGYGLRKYYSNDDDFISDEDETADEDDDELTPTAEMDESAMALWATETVPPTSTVPASPFFSLATRSRLHPTHQHSEMREHTPLLQQPGTSTFYTSSSTPALPHSSLRSASQQPRRNSHYQHSQPAITPVLEDSSTEPVFQPDSQARVQGNSTFNQTVINATSLLLGLGILSEPLAFAYAGWIGGTILIIFFSFLTCYTAKILARIITSDPSLRTYADIGRKAFGPRSTFVTSFLFCLELFSLCVVLVVLGADSLHAVLPANTSNTYKLIALVFLIPTTYLPLSLLSFTSLLSVLATFFVMLVMFADGFTKTTAPGSLWQWAETDWVVGEWKKVGVSFGLFMAGFAGHTAIPSLARDMADPSEFPKTINIAYCIAASIYSLMGAAGYLMFGRTVSDEVSQDLLVTPGYNPLLNRIAMWMLVISPLAKFALASRPLNVTLEILLGIEPPVVQVTPHQHAPQTPRINNNTLRLKISRASLKNKKSRDMNPGVNVTVQPVSGSSSSSSPFLDTKKPLPAVSNNNNNNFTPTIIKKPAETTCNRSFFTMLERTTLTVLVVLTAIAIPSFATVMSFLGAFSAFMLCVIGPICAKMCLEGGQMTRGEKVRDGLILVIAVVMAAWGTVAGFYIDQD